MGIEQTTQVIDAVEGIITGLGRATRGGLNVGEVFGVLAQNIGAIQEAVEGADTIPQEIEDLSLEEIEVLTDRLQDLTFNILRSFSGGE